jgi:MFS family permease
MLLVGLAMFGVFFYNSLFIQNIMGYSAVQTGASFLPMTGLIILVAPLAGKFSDRVGSRWLMGVGMVLLSASLFIFSRLDAASDFWNVFPGLIVGGLGMAFVMTPTTAAAMGSVPVDKAGVGSAVLNSMRQVGGSLGIAVMGAIVLSQVNGIPGTPEAAAGFITGYQHALIVASLIALAGAFLSVATVRKYRHADQAVPEAA